MVIIKNLIPPNSHQPCPRPSTPSTTIQQQYNNNINLIETNTNKPPPQAGLSSRRALPSFHLAGSSLHSPWSSTYWSTPQNLSRHLPALSAQQVPKPEPTRFSFENHRVADNLKHRVLPDISGIPRHDWILGSPQ